MKKLKWWPVSARVILEFDSSEVDNAPWWLPHFRGWWEWHGSGFRIGIFGVVLICNFVRYDD